MSSAGDLPGLDPAWSRRLEVEDADGVARGWHVLDTRATDPEAPDPVATLLCVHGNPTWSYVWRRFLAEAPPDWRAVAVDHLGMGWSERLAAPRTLAQRIDDLGRLTAALGIDGPVVVVAHDWGGLISVGWALAHRPQLRGLVLTNTAVYQAVGGAPPGLIRLTRSAALRDLVCVRTPGFVRAAAALSRPALAGPVRAALAAPYGSAAERRAVGDFVADIPVEAEHPSRAALEAVAEGLTTLADVPALLLWGARDPVFTPAYLDDLQARLPHADVQWYPRASHLVMEDVPELAGHAWSWIQHALTAEPVEGRAEPATERDPLGAQLRAHAEDDATAVAELHDGRTTTTSFRELARRVEAVAAGLAARGVRPGDRVALLVPPGVDLTVAAYACWRAGAVVVVADAGLGLRGLRAALRSAGPAWVIGVRKTLAIAAALRIPGGRLEVADLEERGRSATPPEPPTTDVEAAVLFTSGATGLAKGVVYTTTQLAGQLRAMAVAMDVGPDDRLVAAFAPFALYGPALGIGAAVPDMSVTAPRTLTAPALADAVAAIGATVVFASPAALRNVVATAGGLTTEQRQALGRVKRLMSAGAPVPVGLLRQVQAVVPNAELHTPYGMTEVLPVSDVSLPQLEAAGPGNGVCVGWPLAGVQVRLSPLDAAGAATGELSDGIEVTGEICVRAGHVKARYDRLWVVQQASARPPGWHRTGDVGHRDAEGRLWVEGRLVHVVRTADGPVTPVGVEQRVESLAEVSSAAVAGVGPVGTQQVVVVVVPVAPLSRGDRLASPELAAAVRRVAGVPVAAVLLTATLPTDIRHNSKIDRVRVGRWASRVLAGERAGQL